MRRYEILSELLYTEEHEWVRIIEEGKAECGITDYAQKSLSDVVYVDLPEVGKEVKKGDVVCTIESVKAVSDVFSPLTGRVIDVNHRLKEEPSLINTSPYTEGWIFKIEVTEEIKDLLSADEYQKLIDKIEKGR